MVEQLEISLLRHPMGRSEAPCWSPAHDIHQVLLGECEKQVRRRRDTVRAAEGCDVLHHLRKYDHPHGLCPFGEVASHDEAPETWYGTAHGCHTLLSEVP